MSRAKDDGGQAFPRPIALDSMNVAIVAYPGMTLRDWFAGQALAGILAFPGAVDGNRNKNGAMCAAAAYSYADSLLAERSKP